MLSYFQVLLIFVVPPILLLIMISRYRGLFQTTTYFRPKLIIFLLSIIAFLYTSPWDNYLVATGVWFYDLSLVSGWTIYWVPIEEYLFFILETILVSFLFLNISFFEKQQFRKDNFVKSTQNVYAKKSIQIILIIIWIISILIFIVADLVYTYLTLILIWAIPPLLLQISFGYEILMEKKKSILATIFISTLYLSIVDAIAIYFGTWTISVDFSISIFIGILPIEEIIFFFVTSVLVTFGMALGTNKQSLIKLQSILKGKGKLDKYINHVKLSNSNNKN